MLHVAYFMLEYTYQPGIRVKVQCRASTKPLHRINDIALFTGSSTLRCSGKARIRHAVCGRLVMSMHTYIQYTLELRSRMQMNSYCLPAMSGFTVILWIEASFLILLLVRAVTFYAGGDDLLLRLSILM